MLRREQDAGKTPKAQREASAPGRRQSEQAPRKLLAIVALAVVAVGAASFSIWRTVQPQGLLPVPKPSWAQGPGNAQAVGGATSVPGSRSLQEMSVEDGGEAGILPGTGPAVPSTGQASVTPDMGGK